MMVKRNTFSSLMIDSVANGHQTTKPVMYVNNRRSIRLNDLEAGDSSKTWLGHMWRWTAIAVIRTGRVYSEGKQLCPLFPKVPDCHIAKGGDRRSRRYGSWVVEWTEEAYESPNDDINFVGFSSRIAHEFSKRRATHLGKIAKKVICVFYAN